MDLVEVDIVGFQAAQTSFDRAHDVLAAKTDLVRIVSHRKAHLGGNYERVALLLLQPTPQNLL